MEGYSTDIPGQQNILVFVHKRSLRSDYVFRQIFNRILRVSYRITTQLEEFVAYNGPKLSYTESRLGNEFHIRSTGLLYEKGIISQNIRPGEWRGLPVIFRTGENASVPFDLFSAAFFLITRYEEYLLPQEKRDEHGRFPYRYSTAFSYGFSDKPVVELWLREFRDVFTGKFPDFRFPEPHFFVRPLLAVTVSHAFKNKGFIRLTGGILDDFFHFRLKKTWQRIRYAFSGKKDPYDTFLKFIALQKQTGCPFLAFFLVGTYSNFDHNISPNRPALRRIIKTFADYTDIGLLISYYAARNEEMFDFERHRLEDLIHKPVEKVHFHYYRQTFPKSYRLLWEKEIKADFSMGYPDIIAYRASTAHPFPFYDLTEETETDLMIHPVVISDYKLNFHLRLKPGKALEKLIETGEEIRSLGGWFQPVFHNAVLSEFEDWKGWSQVYMEFYRHFCANG